VSAHSQPARDFDLPMKIPYSSLISLRAFLLKPLVMRDIAGAVRTVLDECNAKR
jgi:hypothetical protein